MSDLVTDQRVHRVCLYLLERNVDLLLIGRAIKGSPVMLPRPYRVKRIYCLFSKGIIQYIEFHIKLFFTLLFTRGDIFLSNDLDTLLPNSLVTRLRRKTIVYDSHEYFTGLPSLTNRPFRQKIWRTIERRFLPSVEHAYTVNNSIRDLYRKETGVNMKVVRNMPILSAKAPLPSTVLLPAGKQILLMQGSGINPDQGYIEAVQAMKLLPPDFLLVIIGDGLIWNELQELTLKSALSHKVMLIKRVPFEQLAAITKQAHLGLCLTKPTCINYLFSLPNKLFDYIHAGIPVLASDVPEVSRIVLTYDVGDTIREITPEAIAEKIKSLFATPVVLKKWSKNTVAARELLNWQAEYKALNEVYDPLLEKE